MPRRILFLCTGNYYRSRFAEALFNHLAQQRRVDWNADSCALAIERGVFNIGPISKDCLGALNRLGVELPNPIRMPRGLCLDDLMGSDHVVALKEAEHRPLLAAKFPRWAGRVEYWHVDDLDCSSAYDALGKIERLVSELLDRLDLSPAADSAPGRELR